MARGIITVLLSLAFAGGGCSPRQPTREERIDRWVAALSWSSVAEECNYVWSVHPTGEAAEQLFKIGRPATGPLIRVLRDPEKAVAAHLVLCEIWRNEPSRPCHGFVDDVHGLPFQYRFGELRFDSDTREHKKLDPQMLAAVERSWIRFAATTRP